MATKKYQIQQLQADDSLLTLHPETNASVVLLDGYVTSAAYENVAEAIEGLYDSVTSLEESVENLPSSLVTGVKGSAESTYRNGNVNITKANIGLGNVDNTSDANKPISTAQKAVNDAQTATNTNLSNRITALEGSVGGLSGAMRFLGKSNTAITDGGTQAPTINNVSVSTSTLKSGDVVLFGEQEYVWNGSKWELFGDEGSYALKTTTINGYSLSNNITLDGSDIMLANASVADAIFELEVAVDDMQKKTDNSLTTTSKQVVGAINEIKTTADRADKTAVANGVTISNITNGTTKVGKASTADLATTAGKFTSAQSIALTGDVTGSASSQAGWSIATTLKNSGVTAGTYSAVTVNAKGIVTAGAKMLEIGGTTPSTSLAVGGLFFKEI